jgi:GNAT superfamily N-acetyltransferase
MPLLSSDTVLNLSLADGTPVLLRPLTFDDKERIERGLKELSMESRLSRFFAPFAHFSERQLEYLTRVDQEQHVAWGALLRSDEVVGLGVGRFARLKEDPETAEIAVTVLDRFQKRGVGSLLFAVLYRLAQILGVQQFRAYVLLSNEVLLHNLQSLGADMRHLGDGVAEIDLRVVDYASELPDSPQARVLIDSLAHVDRAIEEAHARTQGTGQEES